jgi:hypothetical protein
MPLRRPRGFLDWLNTTALLNRGQLQALARFERPCGSCCHTYDPALPLFGDNRFHNTGVAAVLLLRTERLPEGADWLYELKLDGYRALALNSGGKVQPRSRNDNDYNARHPGLVKALGSMPDETVIDGDIVALDGEGRPFFNALQNLGPGEPLVKRRVLIEKHALPTLADPIRTHPSLTQAAEFDSLGEGAGP